MSKKTLKQLKANMDRWGVESVPLVYESDDLPKGHYFIISGHHRVQAAQELSTISAMLVMVSEVSSREEVAAKQLAHNALVGRDKSDLLVDIYSDITTLELQLASGLFEKMNNLPEEAEPVQYQEFVLACLPQDVEAYRNLISDLERMADGSSVSSFSDEVQIADISVAGAFAEILKRIKRAEKIRKNGQAFGRLVQLARERLQQLED